MDNSSVRKWSASVLIVEGPHIKVFDSVLSIDIVEGVHPKNLVAFDLQKVREVVKAVRLLLF